MKIVHVLGDTYFFDFGWVSIPYYELEKNRIVLLDLGLREEGEELCRYFKETGMRPVAVIHSHIHSDHINGILALYDDFKFEIYGSERDLEDELSSFDFSPNNFYDDEMSDLYKASTLYKDIMIESADMTHVNINGAVFKIIKSPGHSVEHRTIITPDNVCYLGDLLMAHRTLETAKLPFSRKLDDDLNSKKNAYNYDYSCYIAAHSGLVLPEEIEEVTKANLDILYSLTEKLKLIFNNNPESSYEANISRFEKEIGLGRHAGVFWIRSTIKEIYKFIK